MRIFAVRIPSIFPEVRVQAVAPHGEYPTSELRGQARLSARLCRCRSAHLVCMELLDDKMQAGYAQDAENNTHGSATTWLNTWSDVLRLCDATGISSIREFDDRFPMTQSLFKQ